MSDFIVSFVGLPSSGKSSIINSLVLKKLLQSEIYRTSTEFKLIEEDIFDDNNNKFKINILPGICNSEETYLHIKNSNLIIWTSDTNKAFLTTYEVNEYNKLKKYIKVLSDISGKLYYVIIMLSKYDNNINDLIIKVKNKFPEEDIILYNAYGRSYHNDKTTYALKKFIEEKIGIPTKSNILFDISKYILNFSNKQEKLYFDKFIIRYNSIFNNKYKYADIIFLFWMKITSNEQLNHLMKIRNDKFDNNYNIFKFINLVIENNQEYLKIINLKLIDYYKDILINNKYSKKIMNNPVETDYGTTALYNTLSNHYKDYTRDDINKLFVNIFKQSSLLDQTEIYRKLFQDDFTYDKTYLIISSINLEDYNKEKFNFTNIFNYYIKKTILDDTDTSMNFLNFYMKILLIINKSIIYIRNTYINSLDFLEIKDLYISAINNKYDYSIIYNKKSLTLSEKFNIFISFLNKLNEDNDYILLNKLQIINILICNETIKENNKYKISFYIHSLPIFIKHDRLLLNRFEHNDTYLNIVNQIWTKIYSNIQIPYNGFIGNFIPIDITELLYT